MAGPLLTINVHFYSVLADYTQTKNAEIKMPRGSSIEQLVRQLANLYPGAFKEAMADLGKPGSSIRIFRNNELITSDVLNKLVMEGDEIRLIPAISGGRMEMPA
jgi:molybdopterin converting factor small subunit